MEEIWKDIDGYDSLYKVSNYGRIKSLKYSNKEVILKPFKDKKGYLRISLRKDGKNNHYLIHRIVADRFIPNYENKPQINHKNCIKTDNRVENLEWVTNEENMKHAVYNNLMRSKFTKKINQYDLNGNFIKTWSSIFEANSIYNTHHIGECCKGKRKTVKGYIWKYANK